MKARIFLMIFAVAAVLTPAVQALVLDNMDNVLQSNGGLWHDERNYNPPLLKQNIDPAYVCDTTGSMMIDYTVFDGGQYDVVPRANIIFPTLTSDMAITFCWYKGNTAGPEHVREVILYSNNLGDSVARFSVATGEESIAVGWHEVTAPISSFVVTQGTFDWSDVDTIDFWVSCWGYVGPWGEDGSYQIMPTNTPIYIDCLQLIPEPASMSLLALGTLALLKRRKA